MLDRMWFPLMCVVFIGGLLLAGDGRHQGPLPFVLFVVLPLLVLLAVRLWLDRKRT